MVRFWGIRPGACTQSEWARQSKVDVSDRIGHAHEGITVQIYGHRSTGHDRDAAELVAGLVAGLLRAPKWPAG